MLRLFEYYKYRPILFTIIFIYSCRAKSEIGVGFCAPYKFSNSTQMSNQHYRKIIYSYNTGKQISYNIHINKFLFGFEMMQHSWNFNVNYYDSDTIQYSDNIRNSRIVGGGYLGVDFPISETQKFRTYVGFYVSSQPKNGQNFNVQFGPSAKLGLMYLNDITRISKRLSGFGAISAEAVSNSSYGYISSRGRTLCFNELGMVYALNIGLAYRFKN